jgi:epoxyqueuosine reductase
MSILKPSDPSLSILEQNSNTQDVGTQLLCKLQEWGKDLGFSQIGIASVDLSHAEPGLMEWLEKGFHGEMEYMSRHAALRARPSELVPGTLSVITASMNYLPSNTPTEGSEWIQIERDRLSRPDEGVISIYARGRDYHKVFRQRLESLAKKVRQQIGHFGYRVFTDSAPVLEVELAQQSGLGWRGKHTLLINREGGSMFFLGEIYADIYLEPTPKTENHCGSCSACLTICPTAAIVAPYKLDARKCISYLTIEHPGPIPLELRSKMGNHIYGCDDCQTICPWNKYAQPSTIVDFDVRPALMNTTEQEQMVKGMSGSKKLIQYLSWSQEEFEKNTSGTPIRRIGYERWLRNISVAMGNALRCFDKVACESDQHASQKEIIKALEDRAQYPSPLVKEHVSWALSQEQVLQK